MRIFFALVLFLFFRIFEIAIFPVVTTFFIPFSLWFILLLFSVLSLPSAVVAVVAVALFETLFAVSNPLWVGLLIAGSGGAILGVRIFFLREGVIGNIFALIAGAAVVHIAGPFLWLVAVYSVNSGSLFIQFFRTIRWNDIMLDAVFISVAAILFIRREREKRVAHGTYV